MNTIGATYLDSAIKRLLTYKTLGDMTFAQLEEKDFYYVPSEQSNSIAVIIQHMHGNMISRWTNFLTEDGEKPGRIRHEPLLAIDAINRQLAHYPHHVGQIVYIGKMIRDHNWRSLSIPKGASAT